MKESELKKFSELEVGQSFFFANRDPYSQSEYKLREDIIYTKIATMCGFDTFYEVMGGKLMTGSGPQFLKCNELDDSYRALPVESPL